MESTMEVMAAMEPDRTSIELNSPREEQVRQMSELSIDSEGSGLVVEDPNELPRSVRWRIQLGLLTLEKHDGEGSEQPSLDDIYEFNSQLIEGQQKRFNRLVEKYLEDETEPEQSKQNSAQNELATTADDPLSNLDPLTAMVREQEAQESRREELYLKYRKERARRRRGLSSDAERNIGNEEDDESGYVDRASISIIEKDIKRLPHPSDKAHEQESRITVLKEALYIYSQEHPTMGYRQGMHEIASYILLVFELEEKLDEDAHNAKFAPFVAYAYHLLESILSLLETAYDASGEAALEEMSRTILGKIYQNNQLLYQHLTVSHNIPPPPIYCTRWVRLLFSREVVGYENVLKLWDGLLKHNSNLMRALEIASAARILLLGQAILHPETSSLELLVNTPAISEIGPFLDLFEKMMQQQENDGPIVIPKYDVHIPAPVMEVVDGQEFSPRHNILTAVQPPRLEQPPKRNSTSFSFKAMRETLGQEVKSIKKKVIASTNEWKQHVAQRGELDGTDYPMSPGAVPPLRASLDERSRSENHALVGSNQSYPLSPFQTHEMIRQQKSHGEQLQQHVWTLQQFLMSIEQQPPVPNQTDPLAPSVQHPADRRIPSDIWEALADIDRIQRVMQGLDPRNGV